MPERTILLFAEDPGAANMLIGLPESLAAQGAACRLVATGHALGQAERLGLTAEPLPEATDAARLLDETTPDGVVCGTAENPRTLGLDLIDAARRRGLPAVGLVDGPANAELRFRGLGDVPFTHRPDIIAVPDAVTAETYRSLGHDAVTAVGHPLVDAMRSARPALEAEGRAVLRRRLGLPVDRPVVTFLAEISDGLDAGAFRRSPDYTLTGRGTSDRRTDIVLDELTDALAEVCPQAMLIVRLHPKSRREEFAGRPEIAMLHGDGPPRDLLYASDLVVGMTTVLLTEALALGRPVLSLLPRPAERAWLGPVAACLDAIIDRRQDLRAALPALLGGTDGTGGAALDTIYPAGAADRLTRLIMEAP